MVNRHDKASQRNRSNKYNVSPSPSHSEKQIDCKVKSYEFLSHGVLKK